MHASSLLKQYCVVGLLLSLGLSHATFSAYTNTIQKTGWSTNQVIMTCLGVAVISCTITRLLIKNLKPASPPSSPTAPFLPKPPASGVTSSISRSCASRTSTNTWLYSRSLEAPASLTIPSLSSPSPSLYVDRQPVILPDDCDNNFFLSNSPENDLFARIDGLSVAGCSRVKQGMNMASRNDYMFITNGTPGIILGICKGCKSDEESMVPPLMYKTSFEVTEGISHHLACLLGSRALTDITSEELVGMHDYIGMHGNYTVESSAVHITPSDIRYIHNGKSSIMVIHGDGKVECLTTQSTDCNSFGAREFNPGKVIVGEYRLRPGDYVAIISGVTTSSKFVYDTKRMHEIDECFQEFFRSALERTRTYMSGFGHPDYSGSNDTIAELLVSSISTVLKKKGMTASIHMDKKELLAYVKSLVIKRTERAKRLKGEADEVVQSVIRQFVEQHILTLLGSSFRYAINDVVTDLMESGQNADIVGHVDKILYNLAPVVFNELKEYCSSGEVCALTGINSPSDVQAILKILLGDILSSENDLKLLLDEGMGIGGRLAIAWDKHVKDLCVQRILADNILKVSHKNLLMAAQSFIEQMIGYKRSPTACNDMSVLIAGPFVPPLAVAEGVPGGGSLRSVYSSAVSSPPLAV